MAKAISIDLRNRVIEAYKAKEGGYVKLSRRFNVARNSVRRWLGLEKKHGNVSPRPHGGGISPKITDEQLGQLKELVAEKPDRTLLQLASEWNTKHASDVHRSSISRALTRANISLKKRRLELSSGIDPM
jgi:transposase